MAITLFSTCSDLRTGDPLLKKLRKTFTVGIGVDISLKCDRHGDSPLSLNSYAFQVAAPVYSAYNKRDALSHALLVPS